MTVRWAGDEAFRFNAALVRRPGRSVERGLRATERGSPDYRHFLREHDAYVEALRRAGLKVTVLDAVEDYPDSVFVEDTALCLPEAMLVLRPGAPSRRGEAALIVPVEWEDAVGDVRAADVGALLGSLAMG